MDDVHRHTAVILLVDDDEEDRWATMRAFEKSRLRNRIVAVESGTLALDYLYNRGEYKDKQANPPPDLVLLDLNMPGIPGQEVLRILKGEPMLQKIPVVVMTTSRQERDVSRSYMLGVNSYVTKPVDFDNFLSIVQELGRYWLELVVLPPKR